jgi:hypothetical protein
LQDRFISLCYKKLGGHYLQNCVKSGIFNKGVDVGVAKFDPVADELKERLQRQSDEVYGCLTAEEREAVDAYTDKIYLDINRYLNGGAYKYPKTPDYVNLIDSAMAKFELEDRITVYKGAEAVYYAHWKVGDIEPISVFLSTSISEDVARYFKNFKERWKYDEIILEINVPKGTRGIYIGNNTAFPSPQDEFFLGRGGLKYRVIERDRNILKLEVVHE